MLSVGRGAATTHVTGALLLQISSDIRHPEYSCLSKSYDKPRLVAPRTTQANFSLTHVRRNLQYDLLLDTLHPGLVIAIWSGTLQHGCQHY